MIECCKVEVEAWKTCTPFVSSAPGWWIRCLAWGAADDDLRCGFRCLLVLVLVQ